MTSWLGAFRPRVGHLAVLSVLAVNHRGSWRVVAGSLLTTPPDAALMSWRRWAALHPGSSRGPDAERGLDPGPRFVVEPARHIRAIRLPLDAAGWDALVSGIARGRLDLMFGTYEIRATAFSPPALLGREGTSSPHRAIGGVSRPVRGAVAAVDGPDMPHTTPSWSIESTPGLKPGRLLGQMGPHRRLLHWPRELMGVDWLGNAELAPPRSFVVGELQNEAWIASMKPDYEAAQIHVSIAWNEQRIDPLGCVVGLQQAKDGLPMGESSTRISHLPPDDPYGMEPRLRAWNERTITVRLSRGLRRADFGVTLDSADGRRLDERELGPRVEQISFDVSIAGAAEPSNAFVVGDKNEVPTAEQQVEGLRMAEELMAEAAASAARNRASTTGDVRAYLRWRLSCRAGELLVMDQFLATDDPRNPLEDTLAYLVSLDRPIRALARRPNQAALEALPALPPNVRVRWLATKRTLHDRFWMVGETGLHVGASINGFASDRSVSAGPMFAWTELPPVDAAARRADFEAWWSQAEAWPTPTTGAP